MSDIFDRMLDRFTSGDSRRRSYQVILSAMLTLILCVAASAVLFFHHIDFKLKASGAAVQSVGGGQAEVELSCDISHADRLAVGQKAYVHDRDAEKLIGTFTISSVDVSRGDKIVMRAYSDSPVQLSPGTNVDGRIVFKRERLGSMLLKEKNED
jgi:hypothetical protein